MYIFSEIQIIALFDFSIPSEILIAVYMKKKTSLGTKSFGLQAGTFFCP